VDTPGKLPNRLLVLTDRDEEVLRALVESGGSELVPRLFWNHFATEEDRRRRDAGMPAISGIYMRVHRRLEDLEFYGFVTLGEPGKEVKGENGTSRGRRASAELASVDGERPKRWVVRASITDNGRVIQTILSRIAARRKGIEHAARP
jgi:hypothetical protein